MNNHPTPLAGLDYAQVEERVMAQQEAQKAFPIHMLQIEHEPRLVVDGWEATMFHPGPRGGKKDKPKRKRQKLARRKNRG